MTDAKTPAGKGSGGKGPAGKGGTGKDGKPEEKGSILTFVALTLLLYGAWFGFLQPMFFPGLGPNKAPVEANLAEGADDPAADFGEEDGDGGPLADLADADPDAYEPNPEATVTLGGDGPAARAAGYAAAATLTSRGAGVERVVLNDPRYRELDDRGRPLSVLGDGDAFVDTFDTRVPVLDAALRPYATDSVTAHWELAETIPDADDPAIAAGAVWRLEAPDGSFAATKTFRLRKRAAGAWEENDEADDDPRGYLLDLDLTLENRGDRPRVAGYSVQGPVGLPLENEENTRKFRDIELGFLEGPGDLAPTYMTAADATEAVREARRTLDADAAVRELERKLGRLQARRDAAAADAATDPENAELAARVADLDADLARTQRTLNAKVDDAGGATLEEWRKPFRYVGTEVQYFAALLFPRQDDAGFDDDGEAVGFGEDFNHPVVASVVPQVLREAEAGAAQKNDVSVRLTGKQMELAPGAAATRRFSLFAGPKRPELLEKLGADDVMDLGWFGAIGTVMLTVMGFFHDLGAPYWLAIISLTVCVRVLMLPMSWRAAVMASKQKALAPKLAEIKKKHGDDLQASGREQMALMRKHGVNPLLGCLPVFFTIPVFVALYNALLNSVDLRLAEFLWIDNLAAPDNLIPFGTTVPYLGRYLNVLPVLLAGLWFFQQKLFMPPAQSPEQELQYKLMGYMMPLSALFIYHLPAGWCLYSIASACWTLTERKLLDRTRNAQIDFSQEPEPREPGVVGKAMRRAFGGPLDRMKDRLAEAAAAAEAAQKDAQMRQVTNKREPAGVGGGSPGGAPNRKGGGNKRKKKRR